MKNVIHSLVVSSLLAAVAACSAGADVSGTDVSSSAAPPATTSTKAALGMSATEGRLRTSIDAFGQTIYQRDCGDRSDGLPHCSILVPTNATGDVVTAQTTPSGWGALDLEAAYKISRSGGANETVGIVLWNDNPNVEADLATYRSQYGLPPCTTANGCFHKINQNGAASPLPAQATGNTALELALDVEMVSAACPNCKIVLVEANTNGFGDLMVAEGAAANAGATFVTNSWGSGEFSGETGNDSSFSRSGVTFFASSGDGAYGVSYPAASPNVVAVGGTNLSTASNLRGWSETVWSSAGSGCSAYESKPWWQHDSGCSNRTVADISAVASGVAMYDSLVGGGWLQVDGTSISSPLTAGIYAATANHHGGALAAYTNPAAFNDVTSGENGSCSPAYLCTGVVGYDGPTGWGSPLASAFEKQNTFFADYTGDRRADGIAVDDGGLWGIAATGSSFGSPTDVLGQAFYGDWATRFGDINGDGRADGVSFDNGGLWVTLGNGAGFNAVYRGLNGAFYGTRANEIADVNGDGRADGVAINEGSTYVALSSGSTFGAPQLWMNGAFYGSYLTTMADVNGDGKADGVAVNVGNTYVMLSNGSSFDAPQLWMNGAFYGTFATAFGDVNGDGKADGVAINQDSTWVMLSTGSGFAAPALWLSGAFYGTHLTTVADVNGDGKADGVAVNGSSTWVVLSDGTKFSAPQGWSGVPFYGEH